MNICVAGWHFHDTLKDHGAYVVSHKEHPDADVVIPNIGLEFHCYDYYLKNKWISGNTLFTHDDNELSDGALDEIAKIKNDQAFIFPTLAEAIKYKFVHGRAIFCSDKLLRRMLLDGGFWYDPDNTGQIQDTIKIGNNHDKGIQAFVNYILPLRYEIDVMHYFIPKSKIALGFRGHIEEYADVKDGM